MHGVLMNYKKQKDAYGEPLSCERAIEICDHYVKEIGDLKNAAVADGEFVDSRAKEIMNDILLKIMKAKLKKDLEVSAC